MNEAPMIDARPPEERLMRVNGDSLKLSGRDVPVGTVLDPEVAARIAACWNAFHPMPIRLIMSMPSGGVAGLGASHRDLSRQLNAIEKSQPFTGWAIVHVDGKQWRTLDTLGMPDWTEDPLEALAFRLRKHADTYAIDDPEDVRVVPAPPPAA